MTEGREVFLLYGYYSDRSGGSIFGVFGSQQEANRFKQVAEASGAQYMLRVVTLIVGEITQQVLLPTK